MAATILDAKLYNQLIQMGTANLKIHCQEVNNLNVFPIPDGDTGDNMLLTMTGGTTAISDDIASLSVEAEKVSGGMLLGARGNSGVILSQFFDGITAGLKGLETADLQQIKEAFKEGVKHAYQAVMTPTEGTILTVAKDSVNYAYAQPSKDILEFFNDLVKEAKISLERTPDLLEVLKKAGVVDSGGAGLVYIYEGMKSCLAGETLESLGLEEVHAAGEVAAKLNLDLDKFTEDSVLEFGYCTELLLRLQNAKCDPVNFDIQVIKDFLNTLGNSVVIFKTGSIVKMHVHTMTPDKVLAFCQQFGEFLTIKIENMSLQHNNLGEEAAGSELHNADKVQEHKKFGFVAVATGNGIKQMFQDNGANYIIDGGQSMNPSAEDFVKAFDIVNAETIFVFPNNGNVILAAQQASKMYDKADIRVIESHTIGDGYSALAMMDPDCDNVDELEEGMKFAMEGVSTVQVTHCVRDAEMDGVALKNGDYIGFLGKKILGHSTERKDTVLKTVDNIDFTDHEVCILIRGIDSTEEEANEIVSYIKKNHSGTEVYLMDGGQDIYSYYIIVE